MADKSYRVRLPTDVVPIHYELTVEPDLERFVFVGVVKIRCDVQVATDTITVNQAELVVSGATFTPAGKEAMSADVITSKVKEMTVAFAWEDVLPVGEGDLEIKFRGIMNDNMVGFYRSSYEALDGSTKYMGCTQFEAIDARRAFPCWDEPGIKAVFVVTLVYPGHLTALSNMPSSRLVMLQDGRKRETFMATPKMSTYLLAYLVGELEHIAAKTKAGVLCRVSAPPGNTARCEYALRTCVDTLDFYNDFFGIPYPLPKLDMVAVPDFEAGAMENWGLVTYRTTELLCDEATVSISQKRSICTCVTHELAHQWFGNLVTMEWWDDLWLNEGFATWMQMFCADALHPHWNIWHTFVVDDQQAALRLDALRSSHPIQVPIGRAETVDEVFDAIAYCKGASVVRMIYAVLGEKSFKDGLRIYFNRHQYGNTETTDLWQAWKEASGKPVDEMMGSWTSQMGFPVLRILNDPFADGADEIEVEQSWFLADGSEEAGDAEHIWFVPVFSGSDKKRKCDEPVFMSAKKQKIALGGAAQGANWLKLNFGQHVPCRILYPLTMIERLATSMASVPVEDRIGLLSDAFALSKAGAVDAVQLVKLLAGFAGERDEKVWEQLIITINSLSKAMMLDLDVSVTNQFKAFASAIVSPAFKELGWDSTPGDDDSRKELRGKLVSAVAKYCGGDPAIAAEALRRTQSFLAAPSDTTSLDANIRKACLCIAMKAPGYEALFDQLLAAHNAITDDAIKSDIYAALGGCPSSALRKRLLQWCLTDEVRAQDLCSVPMSLLSAGLDGANEIWDWMRADYDRIHTRQPTASSMTYLVQISGAGFGTEEKAAEIKTFWEAKPIYKNISLCVSQTVESIRTNVKFVARLKSSPLGTAEFWTGVTDKL